MKKSTLALAIASAFGFKVLTRQRTYDTAFTFRMGAGFPGDVNRTHPASILPGLMNASVQAPRLFGDPVLVDTATNSYRGFITGDTATTIDGVVCRPYPTQQTTGGMTAVYGAGVPSTTQPVDILQDGFIMAKVNNNAAVTKKGAVYVWIAASSGNHVIGGFEGSSGGGSTLAITNAQWNGPADANGIAEIQVWKV